MWRFLSGWLAATLLGAALKTIFDIVLFASVFATAVHQTPAASDLPNAGNALLATVLSYAIDFLPGFAVAFLLSRRFPAAHLGIFMIAGPLALIAPRLIFVGPAFLALLWQNTLAEIAIGSIAGLICGWIVRPREAEPTSA